MVEVERDLVPEFYIFFTWVFLEHPHDSYIETIQLRVGVLEELSFLGLAEAVQGQNYQHFPHTPPQTTFD